MLVNIIEAADLYKSKITDPTPEDWCNVGDMLNYYIGDYSQALLYYSICLQDDPTNKKAMKGFEYAYEHGGDITENDLSNKETDLYSNENSYIGDGSKNDFKEVDDEKIKDINSSTTSLTAPDLTGMDEATAISICTQKGYKYNIEYYLGGNGTVISQSPTSSKSMEVDGSITINIGISQNDFSNRLLALINEKRRSAGLGELSFSEQLNTVCNILAQENVNSVNCIRPNGSHWSSVLGENGILLSDGIFTTRNNITSLSDANGRIKYAGNSYGEGNLLTSSYTIIGMAYSSNNMLVIIVGC